MELKINHSMSASASGEAHNGTCVYMHIAITDFDRPIKTLAACREPHATIYGGWPLGK